MISDVFQLVFMIFEKNVIFMISANRRSDMMIANLHSHDCSKCSLGGECFAPLPSTIGSAPSIYIFLGACKGACHNFSSAFVDELIH